MDRDRLKLAFLGHVDHGKSTLIGRLLYDTGSVPPDRMEQVRQASVEQGHDTELAYLVDHLREEREHSMTIDTAQLFFRAADRDVVVIDAPGHREFLKNMLTGASQAHAAVLLVDAAQGLAEQTQRHAFLLTLLGIRHCLVVINKMDLVGFAEARFLELCEEVGAFAAAIGLEPVAFVPISALHGDNVVNPSSRLPWYDGLTVLEAIDGIEAVQDTQRPFRFCVQDVYAFDGRRIAAGRVEAGTLDVGDPVLVLPDGATTTVLSIERFHSERGLAEAGESIGVTLPADRAVRRGQVLCDPAAAPAVASTLRVRLFWMGDEPLALGSRHRLRLATQDAACRVAAIRRRINSSTLDVLARDADRLATTEVGEVELELDQPVVAELPERCQALGRVVLETHDAVAGAGVLMEPPGMEESER
ncbi:MAG TPA: GTP-binding protein [Planctomycetota bacterium]|nr:GTP-binding protein [Planctomycetota bacterium]